MKKMKMTMLTTGLCLNCVWFAALGANYGLWVDEPFEGNLDGWTRMSSDTAAWHIEPNVGRKGSSALVWENSNADAQPEIRLSLPELTGGRRAEASFWVKIDELKGGIDSAIEWSHYKTKAYLAGAGILLPWESKEIEVDADGWRRVVIRTPQVHNVAGVPVLELFMRKGSTGRLRIDDLQVRLLDEKSVGVVAASGYRGVFCRGDVRLVAQYWASLEAVQAGRIVGEFAYVNAAGRKTTVRATEKDEDALVATVSAGDFRMGTQTVAFTLKDITADKVLGTGSVEVTRAAEMPRRKSSIDEYGRLLVDGRPFFPIGSWWSPGTFRKHPEALERYVTAPFNCVPTYDDNITWKDLDAYHAKGLKVLVSVKNFYALESRADVGCTFPPPDLKTKADQVRYLTEAVTRVKAHPALLGWYTCDEMPRVSAWRIAENHRLVGKLDPEHIQFLDTADHGGTMYFLNVGDVISADPFFGQGGTDYSLEFILLRNRWGFGGVKGVRPFWGNASVSFDYAWCDSALQEGVPSRMPNEAEARALIWIPISVGANGVLLYSIGECYDRLDQGVCTKTAFEANWRIVQKVVGEVDRHKDILLLPPGPKVETPDGVSARTYSDGTGVYLLVCNAKRTAVSATIRFPAAVSCSVEKIFGVGNLKTAQDAIDCDLPPLTVVLAKLTGGK